MTALVVAAQVLVWGTSPASRDGAVLPGLRPVFGVAYAGLLLGLELAFCASYRLRHGAVLVLVAAAAVDVVFWAARLGGLEFPTGAAAALTSGFGAVALAAGVLSGRLGTDVHARASWLPPNAPRSVTTTATVVEGLSGPRREPLA